MGYWRTKGFKPMDLTNLLSGVAPQETQSNEKKALPTGTYSVVVEKVEGKTNDQTGSKGISVQLRVFGAKFNNYVLFDYMMIQGNETALKYSLPKLKKLAVVCGSEETSKWVGKRVSVSVSVDKKDDTKNMIWGYSEFVADDNTPISNNTSVSISTDEIPF